jgi:hypothetical protein
LEAPGGGGLGGGAGTGGGPTGTGARAGCVGGLPAQAGIDEGESPAQ